MWGLFSKRSREQAPPQPVSLADEIEAACARQAEARRARPVRGEAKRFAHARPKLEQLRAEYARQWVDL